MSAYTVIQTQLMSPAYLVKALRDLGFTEVEQHATPQPLVGYFNKTRDQLAEVIIRRKYVGNASNDIGFVRGRDGKFTAIISEFDRDKYGDTWLMHLNQRYAYHVVMTHLAEQGFDLVQEQIDETKTIRLTLRRMT